MLNKCVPQKYDKVKSIQNGIGRLLVEIKLKNGTQKNGVPAQYGQMKTETDFMNNTQIDIKGIEGQVMQRLKDQEVFLEKKNKFIF